MTNFLKQIKIKFTTEEYNELDNIIINSNFNHHSMIEYVIEINKLILKFNNFSIKFNKKLSYLNLNNDILILLIHLIQPKHIITYFNIINNILLNKNIFNENEIKNFISFYYCSGFSTLIFDSKLYDISIYYLNCLYDGIDNNNKISTLLKLKNSKLNFKRINNIYTKILLKN